MTHSPLDPRAGAAEAGKAGEPIQYPVNRVLGVIDSAEQLTSAVDALTNGGFLASEVEIRCGAAAAERLDKSTGRGGLAGLAIRIAERLGVANEEMESKEQYERALHDGRFVLSVAAPTDERKAVASQILHECGATLVRFFGRYTIERMAPPGTT